MSYYATTKDPGTGPIYPYTDIWDAEQIYGCNCDNKFYGPDCSQRHCPTGDDPLTGTGQNTPSNANQFNEIQKVFCKGGSGSFTLTFRGKTTAKIPYNAKAVQIQSYLEALPTVNGVQIVMYAAQACLDDGAAWTVEFTQDFGDLPLMVADASGLKYSNAVMVGAVSVSVQVQGTKEDLDCSNRGICDATTGYCACSTGFDTSDGYNLPGQRGDCGYATTTIQACPGLLACSAHGECIGDPQYRCECSVGWTGADCSERVCPKDTSWFTLPQAANLAHVTEQHECSDMGVCDRVSGTCQCVQGFTGASCNRIKCPGDTEACNGHGQCLSMSQLAALATDNGVPVSPPYTYGNAPNNPLTWDAERMFGCYCDAEWTGFDCSLRLCPLGADPTQLMPEDEQQIITCTNNGTAGAVVFSFRGSQVPQLSHDASSAQVQAALQSVPAVGLVSVDVNDAAGEDRLCSPKGSAFLVTFRTTHGPLPLLQYSVQNIANLFVTEYRKGNKAVLECSGRGVCDRALGLCECFDGYGSSDGVGGAGTMRDCGYVLPVVAGQFRDPEAGH